MSSLAQSRFGYKAKDGAVAYQPVRPRPTRPFGQGISLAQTAQEKHLDYLSSFAAILSAYRGQPVSLDEVDVLADQIQTAAKTWNPLLFAAGEGVSHGS